MNQDVLKKYKREEELPKEADEETLKREFEELKKEVPATFPPEETEEPEKKETPPPGSSHAGGTNIKPKRAIRLGFLFILTFSSRS